MSTPPPLTPMEQQEKLAEITRLSVPTMPEGWQRLIVRVSIIGNRTQKSAGVLLPDDTTQNWRFPPGVWDLFLDLRIGMYVPDVGTWVEFEYILDPPGRFQIRYNQDKEPAFDALPPAEEFARELRWFPRSPEHTPDWFRHGLEG